MRYFLISCLALTLSSCVSLKSVSLTQIPKTRKNRVKAEASKLIFLALNFNNDFVEEVPQKLKEKCRKGKVTGILTKDEVTSYFLFFKRTVTAQGYCVR